MNRIFSIQRKWKWIGAIGLTFVLVLVFAGLRMNWERDSSQAAGPYTFTSNDGVEVPAGGTLELRRAQDRLTLSGYEMGDVYEWESMNTDVLTIDPSNTYTATVHAQDQIGDAVVNVRIIHNQGTPEQSEEVVSLTVSVVFSINEFLSPAAPAGVSMERIQPTDARKALIMDYGSMIEFGTSAQTQQDKLNLIFGSAADESTLWKVNNNAESDVVNVVRPVGGTPFLKAVGAGVATLSVEYSVGSTTYRDSIQVYVRPQVTNEDGEVIAGAIGQTTAQEVPLKNGEKINLSVLFDIDPLQAIGDKLTWVISKGEGEDTVLVRDSLGNTGPDGADAKLTPLAPQYRLDAKAGIYNIQFYVKGTYTSFEAARENPPACLPVSLKAKVPAEYEDKEVTVNINGSYDLAEAFNIPKDVFLQNFQVDYDLDHPFESSDSYISISNGIVHADQLGTGAIKVSPRDPDVVAGIPGISSDHLTVRVIIHVTEEFTMNQNSATMPVGSTLNLYGIIGSGAVAESERFTWTVSDSTYVRLESDAGDGSGQYATITALRKTPTNSPVLVTLTWLDNEGINHTTTCRVTVIEAANNFKINPATEILEVGGTSKMLDTGLTGTQNIQWISSDDSKVVVTPLEGNTKATISAVRNTGQAVITAINLNNGVFATCLVTVSAPITSITIDKGTDYSTTMAEGMVQMRAIYQPTNATNTTLIWTSSDESVATVDEFGRVTLLREGDTYISVRPEENPNNVHADCFLHIVENPITQITPDVTELEMITGDTYGVSVNILPENPSDRTLQWSSSDESIATVSGGIITAVSAGDAVISISGGKVGRPVSQGSGEQYIPPVTIRVHVRNRLQKIEFGQKVVYVPLGGTQQLNVIFTPDVNINDKLVWNSSDTSVVTVSEEGILTGISIGSAMVSCYAEDMGPEHLISCMVHVTDQTIVPATGLTVLPETSTMEVGQTLQMDAVFAPENTTNQYIQWSSSDKEVATITPEGLVTAVAVGEVTITAIYDDTPDGIPWILYSKITVIPATVEATDFDVTPDSVNMKVREKFTITPVFTPAETTDKSVEYQSTDETVATVSETGVVTAVGAGDCLIQCQANSGGFIATCAVHVENAIQFKLNPSYREIAVGKSFSIGKVTVPANADKTAVWSSSNTSIATVSSTGKVTGKKIGSCTITCTLTEYNQSATCRVKVAKLNSKVSLNKKKIRIGINKTYRLKATVWTNNSKNPALKWKSANKKIASVSSKGKVKGKKIGVTKITVMTKDKVKAKATCRVTVIRRVTSVKMNTAYALCYVGRTKQLRASVRPKKASIKKLKWSSSNKKIAVVSGSGKVTGMSVGDVTITAKATDGSGKKATCLVKVLEEVPASSVVVAQTKLTMKKGDSTKLTYSVLPNNTSDHISFASDNKRVATVNSNGKVKAVGTGVANITILAGSGITTTVVVNVVDLNKPTLNMRQYDTETLQVFGTEDDITWYSSNARIATVDGGTVTGRGIGSTYIYAYVNGCKLACKVTITSVNKK